MAKYISKISIYFFNILLKKLLIAQKVMDEFKEKSISSHQKSFSEKWMPSLYLNKEPIHNLWKITKDDIDLSFYMIIVIFITWVLSLAGGSFLTILAYWDGPNYVFAARTLYNISNDNPWTREFQYQPSYFACHFPGFPLVIRFFSTIFFNCYWLGDLCAIVFCSLASLYAFRRLLIVYNAVVDPKWTAFLYIFIPIRFLIYRSVGASEPLFCFYCYMALICYKTDHLMMMLFALIGACITRIEGLSIVGTIGLCYLLKLDLFRAIFTAISFLATGLVFLMHKYRFGDIYAYFKFNMEGMRLIRFPPFYLILNDSKNFKELVNIYPTLYLHFVFLLGLIVVFHVSLPLAIFSTVYFLYNTLLNHIDRYRYALPGYTLTLLIGFDCLWSHPKFKNNFLIFAYFYIFIAILYCIGNICTNRSSDEFILEVLNPVKYPYKPSQQK
ncbi:hypothetical protein TRFO_35283 [Tritrichomonas foetus]|uniref:GPI mannosyltransferase 2 n=1 Tax=Tritrichomonas foetus TaxID=1144522 RepID=A0A1J4JM06_9EUKA|nr:hypothetical protein TRFO_35283 [Tritrichomonas foetus]|eukprot:OHS98308.1 hypothetical protein TRFO_35283 [Tritrichomonas foetus]